MMTLYPTEWYAWRSACNSLALFAGNTLSKRLRGDHNRVGLQLEFLGKFDSFGHSPDTRVYGVALSLETIALIP